MLHLGAAQVGRVRDAARALATPEDFPDPAAWAAAAIAAVQAVFGSDAGIASLPALGAPGVAGRYVALGVDDHIQARCERLFRLGTARSDDPAARDPDRILAACAATGQRTWTGPAFVARAGGLLGGAEAVRRSAWVHEVIVPAGMWRGPHLHVRHAGADSVIGCSAPRPSARLGDEETLLLAELLQPAFAAGVRAAQARWGAAASRPAPGPAAPAAAAGLRPRRTPREREVAALLAARRTNAEVAAALGVSAHTARHHVERVMRKLGVRSRRAVSERWAG